MTFKNFPQTINTPPTNPASVPNKPEPRAAAAERVVAQKLNAFKAHGTPADKAATHAASNVARDSFGAKGHAKPIATKV